MSRKPYKFKTIKKEFTVNPANGKPFKTTKSYVTNIKTGNVIYKHNDFITAENFRNNLGVK